MTDDLRTNLLVIMVDQLRATALGLYGNDKLSTPGLEQLAADGTLFEQAFTPYPVCVPARVALWTGRWPHLTHARSNNNYMADAETHLPGLLHDEGWRTALIGKNHCFTETAMARTFDHYYPVGHQGPYDTGDDPEVAAARDWIRDFNSTSKAAAFDSAVNPHPVSVHPTTLIGNETERFLRDVGEAPFCAWVSFPDPHTPYQVPEPYASRHPAEDIVLPDREPPGYPGKPARFRAYAERLGANDVDEATLRRAIGIYYGMIALLDDTIGSILRTLAELDLTKRTVVVFTSDHGDYMGEHGLVRKGSSLYDSLVRVPLIVSCPGTVPSGVRSDALVSLLDLFPTLAPMLGVRLPPGLSGTPLPTITGASPRFAVFSESGFVREPRADASPGGAHPWHSGVSQPLKMVRTTDWKYVYSLGGTDDELYSLRDDPGELINLAGRPEHHDRVQEFRAMVLDWLIESEDTIPAPARTPDRSAGSGSA